MGVFVDPRGITSSSQSPLAEPSDADGREEDVVTPRELQESSKCSRSTFDIDVKCLARGNRPSGDCLSSFRATSSNMLERVVREANGQN